MTSAKATRKQLLFIYLRLFVFTKITTDTLLC